MWFAQISDMHVTAEGGGTNYSEDTGPCLERCVAALLGFRPRPVAVVASGDLVNAGGTEEYARLRALLAPLDMPVWLMPGNHDERDALRAQFADHDYLPSSGTLHYARDVDRLRLIMLDTVIPGAQSGTLDETQLAWLEDELASHRQMPTVIFMHHPPVATGMHRMDAIGLDTGSARRLARIIGRHRHVERVACGHVHRAAQVRWSGTLVSVCPSTAFQAQLDFSVPGHFAAAPEDPGFQAHYWTGEALVTHTVAVPDYDRKG